MSNEYEFGITNANINTIYGTNNSIIDLNEEDYTMVDLLQMNITSTSQARTTAMGLYITDSTTNAWGAVKWQNNHGLEIINWYKITNGTWPSSPNFTESAGGNGSDTLPSNYSGQEVVSFDVSSINSVNSQSSAKSVVESMVDFSNYDTGVWVGIRWSYGDRRNLPFYVGNASVNRAEYFTRIYTTWYSLNSSKALVYQSQDVSTA